MTWKPIYSMLSKATSCFVLSHSLSVLPDRHSSKQLDRNTAAEYERTYNQWKYVHSHIEISIFAIFQTIQLPIDFNFASNIEAHIQSAGKHILRSLCFLVRTRTHTHTHKFDSATFYILLPWRNHTNNATSICIIFVIFTPTNTYCYNKKYTNIVTFYWLFFACFVIQKLSVLTFFMLWNFFCLCYSYSLCCRTTLRVLFRTKLWKQTHHSVNRRFYLHMPNLQASRCLQYLLFLSGHSCKYWTSLSLLNLLFTLRCLVWHTDLRLLTVLSGHPRENWIGSLQLNFIYSPFCLVQFIGFTLIMVLVVSKWSPD